MRVSEFSELSPPVQRDYALGEMFSGPGGIALGAQAASAEHARGGGKARVHHAWAVDYHPDTVATYVRNICGGGDETVWTADVREFDLLQVPEFDAFAFGFPCNDFSNVGERRGLDGSFGALYTYGVHALALHAPEWFVAENVSGLFGANKGAAFGRILDALQHPGRAAMTDSSFKERYAVALDRFDESLEYELVAHLYKFEEYGVPQRRHRILIVGIRRDIREALPAPFRVPAPTTAAPRSQKTAAEALADISPDAANHYVPKHPARVRERLEAIAPGKSAFNTSFEGREHLQLNVKGATLSNIYRRLEADKPAYTVTGSGGGGTHMYHWEEPRALSNRERARIQTFPDWFKFEGTRPSVRRQIGMAVPPEGAEIVFSALLKTLDGIDYPYVVSGPNVDVRALITAYRSASVAVPREEHPERPDAPMLPIEAQSKD